MRPLPIAAFFALLVAPAWCGAPAQDPAPTPTPVPTPVPERPAAGPIDPAQALLGTWVGDVDLNRGVELELRADGTGTFGAEALSWSVSARSRMTLVIAGERQRATYTLTDGRLAVTLDGEVYGFTRKAGKPKLQGYQVPPPIEGADTGPTTPHAHSKGFYSFELPTGWSVGQEEEDGLWINPGLTRDSKLEALVRLAHGELDADDRDTAPVELVKRYSQAFLHDMAELGIQLQPATDPPRAVLVGEVPGALQEWRGKTDAGLEVRVWFAGVVKREYYLTVTGVLVEATSKSYVPRLVRLFTSLVPRPPERNAELEQALAGRRFSKREFFGASAGSSRSTYDFRAAGSVLKELYMGGLSGMVDVTGSSEEWGRYEVVGDLVYLYFPDGQTTAEALVENGVLAGLTIHGNRYVSN